MNKTIGIVSGSKKQDGIQIDMLTYKESLSSSYEVKWYQCVDPTSPDNPDIGIPVMGIKFPNTMIEMGINRVVIFPRRFRPNGEALFILSDPTLLNIANRVDNVLVKIHDLRPLTIFSDNNFAWIMYRHILKNLRKVKGVIVTTKWMSKQILNYVKEDQLILVIPETHSMKASPLHKIESSINRLSNRTVNITYIASDRPYKNIFFFLELAKRLSNLNSHKFQFLLVSKLKKVTKNLIHGLNIQGLKVYQNVEDMSEIYNYTDIYVHPSLYEGFGRPIIEAMAYGIPVISNSIEPFFEIMGDSGKKISIDRIEDWIIEILNLSNPINYKVEAEKSLKRSGYFNQEHFDNILKESVSLIL